jgi:hypothetical protein
MAMPKTGMKNNSEQNPQNMPRSLGSTMRMVGVDLVAAVLSRTIIAIASGWMIRSWASRRASSAAASAVA